MPLDSNHSKAVSKAAQACDGVTVFEEASSSFLDSDSSLATNLLQFLHRSCPNIIHCRFWNTKLSRYCLTDFPFLTSDIISSFLSRVKMLRLRLVTATLPPPPLVVEFLEELAGTAFQRVLGRTSSAAAGQRVLRRTSGRRTNCLLISLLHLRTQRYDQIHSKSHAKYFPDFIRLIW